MNKKPVIILLAIVLAIVVIGSIILSIVNAPKGKVHFTVSPHTVTLLIGGKSQMITNDQELSFAPGDYTFTFSQASFKTATERVTVEKDDKKTIIVALQPTSADAEKSTDKTITAQYNIEQSKKFFDILPFKGSSFEITSCSSLRTSNKKAGALCITSSTTSGEQAGISFIRSSGYDPSNFELLIGTEQMKTILSSPNYIVKYYSNFSSDKPSVFVTIPPTITDQAMLTSVRNDLLETMKKEGYDTNSLDIYYENVYLGLQFNPVHEEEGHAEAPVQ